MKWFRHSRSTERISKREIGRWGERVALRHLLDLGWDVVARNWRGRAGELDLVAFDDTHLVAVEVKTLFQKPGGNWLPEVNLDRRQEERLYRLGLEFLTRHEMTGTGVRVDLIAIETGDLRTWEIRHLIL